MIRTARAALIGMLALTLVSCAATPSLSEEDAAALTTLAQVAGPTSNVDAASLTRTQCWLPSANLVVDSSVSATTWRVLCRAHYTDASGERYQDTTCVGDFADTPMIDHCYRWVYYTGMPRFEDQQAFDAP